MSQLTKEHEYVLKTIITENEKAKGWYIQSQYDRLMRYAGSTDMDDYTKANSLNSLINAIVDSIKGVYHRKDAYIIYKLLLLYIYDNVNNWKLYIKNNYYRKDIEDGEYDDVFSYLNELSNYNLNESFTKDTLIELNDYNKEAIINLIETENKYHILTDRSIFTNRPLYRSLLNKYLYCDDVYETLYILLVIYLNYGMIGWEEHFLDLYFGELKPKFTNKIRDIKDIYKDVLAFLLNPKLTEAFRSDIYYHGTTDKFDKFNQPINWFTTDRDYAEEFATWLQMPSAYIYSVNLDLKNILDCGNTSERINTKYMTGEEKFNPHFRELMSKLGVHDIDDVTQFVDKVCKEFGIKHIKGYIKDDIGRRIDLITRSDAFRNLCLAKGYTGIKCLEKKDYADDYATTYGIFDSKDIKILDIESLK